MKRISVQQTECANQAEEARRAALVAAQLLPKREYYIVSAAQPMKGGYLGKRQPCVQHSYSNSRVPDATGLNRTYTWTKDFQPTPFPGLRGLGL